MRFCRQKRRQQKRPLKTHTSIVESVAERTAPLHRQYARSPLPASRPLAALQHEDVAPDWHAGSLLRVFLRGVLRL
jgi:hypothetical protein